MALLQSRKLKIDKKFLPNIVDSGDEIYPNGIFEFNITKLLTFIKANSLVFQPKKITIKEARGWPSSNLNESTIKTANLAEPIIYAEIAPDRFNVIDGRHRLEKAYRDGASTILAYKIKWNNILDFLLQSKHTKSMLDTGMEKLSSIV